jgi:hypothetical protein
LNQAGLSAGALTRASGASRRAARWCPSSASGEERWRRPGAACVAPAGTQMKTMRKKQTIARSRAAAARKRLDLGRTWAGSLMTPMLAPLKSGVKHSFAARTGPLHGGALGDGPAVPRVAARTQSSSSKSWKARRHRRRAAASSGAAASAPPTRTPPAPSCTAAASPRRRTWFSRAATACPPTCMRACLTTSAPPSNGCGSCTRSARAASSGTKWWAWMRAGGPA